MAEEVFGWSFTFVFCGLMLGVNVDNHPCFRGIFALDGRSLSLRCVDIAQYSMANATIAALQLLM